jgi:release factor glutamine methyltransferase
MTLIELRERTETWFAGLGIPSARLDAEVLIGHALGIQRLTFITDGTRPLTDEELEACRELVRRRGKREPVAYILGSREFFSREFAVDERVLIPRPETEHLVDLALLWLTRGPPEGEVIAELDPQGSSPEHKPEMTAALPGVETSVEYDEQAPLSDAPVGGIEPLASVMTESSVGPSALPEPDGDDAGVVLDYGCGSGAIAITLATEQTALRVLAVDISREALDVARTNAETHSVADRIGFVSSDGLQRVPPRFRGSLRAIVANPPYVPLETAASLSPDVRDWEPQGALFAGDDPLMHYRRLACEGRDWLAHGGFLAMEVGIGQADEVAELLRVESWKRITIKKDLAGIPRVVAGWAH